MYRVVPRLLASGYVLFLNRRTCGYRRDDIQLDQENQGQEGWNLAGGVAGIASGASFCVRAKQHFRLSFVDAHGGGRGRSRGQACTTRKASTCLVEASQNVQTLLEVVSCPRSPIHRVSEV